MLEVKVKNLNRLAKSLAKNQRKVQKNFKTAVKVEGFRLRKALMRDLARGRAGNTEFEPLTAIGRYWTSRRRSPRRKPLAALARGVTYSATGGYGGEEFRLAVGFTDRTGATWRRMARFQQTGGTVDVSDFTRRGLANIGGRFGRRSTLKKYFFLKKSTNSFKVPARPIIEPFWRANEDDAWRNIRKNFINKTRGLRI